MNRRVTSTHIPYLPITVEIPEQKLTAEFNALVDTGFSGEIVVPHAAVSDNTAACV
jgi:predicted aspartyl protease